MTDLESVSSNLREDIFELTAKVKVERANIAQKLQKKSSTILQSKTTAWLRRTFLSPTTSIESLSY